MSTTFNATSYRFREHGQLFVFIQADGLGKPKESFAFQGSRVEVSGERKAAIEVTTG